MFCNENNALDYMLTLVTDLNPCICMDFGVFHIHVVLGQQCVVLLHYCLCRRTVCSNPKYMHLCGF